MARLSYILKGIKRVEAEKGGSQKVRLPITPHISHQMKAVWAAATVTYDRMMIWAACCLCFFGFLCVREMVALERATFEPTPDIRRHHGG